MKLVVGLGNPGRRYEGTRHNVGFRVARALARRVGLDLADERFAGRFGCGRAAPLGGLELGILLPETWMNRSGDALEAALEALPSLDPSRDVCAVLDDADLPFGRLRLRARGSDGGHNGLADLLRVVGGRELPRLRFGIGRPEGPVPTRDFVLDRFSEQEEAQLPAHLDRAADALACFLTEGVAIAMGRFNADPGRAGAEAPEGDDPAGGTS